MRPVLISALLLLTTATGCEKRIACFDADVVNNSATTKRVFEQRHCQGGGVTWAGIFEVIVARKGRVTATTMPSPGWTGSVYMLNGETRFAIDEEGDAARFCSDDPALLSWMRGEHARLNADGAALLQALHSAPALRVECSEADGTSPRLPSNMFPVPVER